MASSSDARHLPDPARLTAARVDDAGAPAAAPRPDDAGATSPADAFLTDALAELAGLLGVEAGSVLLPEGGSLRVAAASGLPPDWLAASDENELPDGFHSCVSVPLTLADGRALGLFVGYGRGTERPAEETVEQATAYGSAIALGLERVRTESDLAARYQAVVVALTSALDTRDHHVGAHSTETSLLAQQVGRRLGMTDAELELVAQVAVLHDIGKLGVSTQVLLKPGPLEPDEQALMREHPLIGERILSGIPGLGEVAAAIRCEHERWDGLGYPDGVAGEQIPLASRIVFACDAWRAMRTDRPYRPAISPREALAELHKGAGRQFDPRVAQALLQILGEGVPPAACSPTESRDRVLSRELSELASALGAEDLFVFRRVSPTVFSHLGGAGRGAGWAGNIELDSRDEHHLRAALRSGLPTCVELEHTGRIAGPYYGRSAVLVPCAGDTVVVFGSSTDSVAGACADEAARLAEHAHRLVTGVSPSKRLADELEVLTAVREVTTVNADSMIDTLSAIASRVRTALSAEFAAAATIPSSEVDWALGTSARDWAPNDPDAAARALARFGARVTELPILIQDLADIDNPPGGFSHADGVSSMHVLPIGTPPVATMLVVHAGPGLRGFTALCQRVAGGMSDAAELVLRRAIAQDRLRAENARLAEKVRTDELTGVASRAAWEEALRAEDLHHGRSGAPVSVVIVDADELKMVNDHAGHGAGDELLRTCAALLADSLRGTDLVARIGGDEFGVLLRYTDAEQARLWCQRLGERLLACAAPRPRWSLGCASVPPCATVAEAVFEADQRMYERKLVRRTVRR
jgi:diguanylate cyclase (GGDEF)-like protein